MSLVTVLALPSLTSAGAICPDSSYVVVGYACRFTGSYRTGEPKDRVSVSPGTASETFAENGISIQVYLRDCQGQPVVGVSAESVTLSAEWLFPDPGGNIADGPSDEAGRSTFSGRLAAAGCVLSLDVKAEGQLIDTIPLKTNSPDDIFTRPCVDSDDLSLVTSRVGAHIYAPCSDFNEDGILDAVDFAEFVSRYYLQGCRTSVAAHAPASSASGRGVTEPPVSIGLYFDQEGTICGGEIHPLTSGHMWIVAHVTDRQGPPIVGAEFRLAGFPPGYILSIGSAPLEGQRIGSGDGDGNQIVGLYDPQPVDQGFVILSRVNYIALTEEVPRTVVRIEGSSNPSNPSFTGPAVIVEQSSLGCGSHLQAVPAVGLEAVINGDCMVGVARRTWQQVKSLYRDPRH